MNGSARMRISQHTVNSDWRPALSEPSKGSPSTRADRSFCFTRRAAAVGSPITSSTLAKQRRGHLCPKVADPRATADEWRDSRSTERSQDVTPLSINRANDGREPLSPSSPTIWAPVFPLASRLLPPHRAPDLRDSVPQSTAHRSAGLYAALQARRHWQTWRCFFQAVLPFDHGFSLPYLAPFLWWER